MDFYAVLDHVVALLQQRGRVTYNALKLQFSLDDEQLVVLKDELLYAHPQVVEDAGRGLRWTGDMPATRAPAPPIPQPISQPDQPRQGAAPLPTPRPPEAERRQLTVLFCDLADSTRLARQLDPEDLREVVLAYQATGVEVIQRFDGYIAQYLGDGLLVYFGYPQAHEDDAQRAVRTGLGILDAMGTLNTRLAQAKGIRLAVRIGIHTGPVVVGTMGSGDRHEQLALGETPNLAARLQGLAAPDTVAISDTTHRLVQGYFTCDDFGLHSLKGVETPTQVYRVVGESAAQSRLDVAEAIGLTPLVGREHEVGLLQGRWAQSKDGLGQVVLLSGEAGIGKSRLVRVLAERVAREGAPQLTLRCSPYHTNSAFYPVIEHLQRLLQWHHDESPTARLAALEQALQRVGLLLAEVVPLLAALLGVPVPEERYAPLALSPQRQKQKTQEALVAWLLAEAAQQPVLAVWEDLHWADPSTLELLELLLDHVPTASLLLVLTARPEFRLPWAPRSYVTPLTLTRLTRHQSEAMVLQVTEGKPLPAEVLAQVVAKTDGIPLFVEELVKTILEAGLVQEDAGLYVLTGPLPPLAIPTTLQDALMARLDRLATVKDVAQLGAVLGREFSYELIQAVAPVDETTLQYGLAQLVDAELLYQRGRLPHATYLFKHALIQEAAYQSLLKSTRQLYHQRIAQVLATQFAEIVETQPELLAHHCTEAGLTEQAVGYWQQAGRQAAQRSAHVEAIAHLNTGLALLRALPDTPGRAQHELVLQTLLGPELIVSKSFAALEVAQAYTRARELCQQVGDTPQLFPVLRGLWVFYLSRAELRVARELGEQLLSLAQRAPTPALFLEAHRTVGETLYWLGALTPARQSLEQGVSLYDPQQHRSHAFLYGEDPGVACLSYAALTLWSQGYPDQALTSMHTALTLAQEHTHRFSLARALALGTMLHQCRREGQLGQERAEAAITLSTEQGFPHWLALGTFQRGWALAVQGQGAEGIAQMHQGLATRRAAGAELGRPLMLALLAEAYGGLGQAEEGLALLAEALAVVNNSRERHWKAELYRLKGELLLEQAGTRRQANGSRQPWGEAEACFHHALAVARRQQAKSLELRAAMSLARLWQQQGKRAEACELLAPVYDWFTEGFDTADLQDAKALLAALI
jgi:class 3 adenylate cyclase/predicted ATPase